jgi:hypothetical protein
MNKIFEVLGENKKYIEFYHTARAREDPATCAVSLKRHRLALLGHCESRWRLHSDLLGYSDSADAVCD